MEVCGFLSKKAPISVACITSIYDNILILSVWICSSSNKENSRVAEQLWSIVHSPWGIGPESRCTCQPARVPFYPKSSSKWEWEKRTNCWKKSAKKERKQRKRGLVTNPKCSKLSQCSGIRLQDDSYCYKRLDILYYARSFQNLWAHAISALFSFFFLAPTFLKILTQNHEGQIKKLLEGVSGDTKQKPNKSWI